MRRQAINYYFSEHPPKSVTPERLSEFLAAFPPWLQSAFDPHPPEEAQRRLTIVYRLVFPHPSEIKLSPKPVGRRRPALAPRPQQPGPASPHVRQAAVPNGQHSLVSRGVARGDESMSNEEDVQWMRAALAEAEQGGAGRAQPLVGAVVVRDGRCVGSGHHERFGGPHAEIVALERAGERRRRGHALRDARALLPFRQDATVHDAILAAGIVRVVAAMRDPFPEGEWQRSGACSKPRDWRSNPAARRNPPDA